MNIIYEFTNLKPNVAPSLDGKEMVITRIHYTYLATDVDSGKSASIQNYQDFELVTESVFTPFISLSESIVLSWLETKSNVENFNELLRIDLENQISEMYVEVDAPWQITQTTVEEHVDTSTADYVAGEPAAETTVTP